jgi:hypothetical protein
LHKTSIGLGIKYVILANHLVSLITSSTTDPRLLQLINNSNRNVDHDGLEKIITCYLLECDAMF